MQRPTTEQLRRIAEDEAMSDDVRWLAERELTLRGQLPVELVAEPPLRDLPLARCLG